MVKFAETLFHTSVPEWREKYIDYQALSQATYAIAARFADDPIGMREVGHAQWLILFERELTKANEWFVIEFGQLRSWYDKLVPQREELRDLAAKVETRKSAKETAVVVSAAKKLKKSMFELYRALDMLRNFCVLNWTASVKSLKKWDKHSRLDSAVPVRTTLVEPLEFYRALKEDKSIQALTARVETLFSLTFSGSDIRSAQQELRALTAVNRIDTNSAFRLGLFLGLCIPLVLLVMSGLANNAANDVQYPFRYSSFAAFRGIGLPIYLIWISGFNVLVWTRARVNYEFIFEFYAKQHLSVHQIFSAAAILSCLYLTCAYLYINTAGGSFLFHIPAEVYVLTLLTVFFGLFMFPSRSRLQGDTRRWIAVTLGKTIIAPFRAVRFVDNYFGDQLCSLSLVLVDIQYVTCWMAFDYWFEEDNDVTSSTHCYALNKTYFRPILSILPFWWRFWQCIRRYRDDNLHMQLINAGKYATSMAVVVLSTIWSRLEEPEDWGPWRKAWLVAVVVGALYAYAWDLTQDWGLLRKGSKYPLLRPKLAYSNVWVYYWCMVSNLGLRFAWTMSISPSQFGLNSNDLTLLLAFLEVTRRGQWNFIRVENEHLTNCSRFRAVKDIPLPFSTQREMPSDVMRPSHGVTPTTTLVRRLRRHPAASESTPLLDDTSSQVIIQTPPDSALGATVVQPPAAVSGENSDNGGAGGGDQDITVAATTEDVRSN